MTTHRRRGPSHHPWSYFVVLVVALVSLTPFVYLVFASFRRSSPTAGVFSLWTDLFTKLAIPQYLWNSIVLSVVVIALVLVISSAAGFGFAKLAYPGSKVSFLIIGACILVPLPSIVLAQYIDASSLGLLQGFIGAIVIYVGTALPLATVLMASFFGRIPDSIMESGLLDGASYARMFWRLFVPMAGPVLATVAALEFINVWNGFLVSLLFLPDQADWTIGVGLATLAGTHAANLNLLLTGCLVSAVPTLLVYVFFQRYLVAGITGGIEK